MAKKFIGIRKSFAEGNLDCALKLQGEANEIISVLIKIGVFRGVKGILSMRGLGCGNCRSPFAPLNTLETEMLEKVMPLIGQ